ncbi:hypothetical protein ZIOFF_051850 [Zingiber officinale]|uniref:Large ribosomal subunit protein uL6 alpha-beta domain-containing protein n=1 Tax=Zingiber officinale TaxID=94328 RepID=A0A8J5FL75_ZINOF|nr:hypothetical protein ZIOFF_051850 [Zingiber officinale]
MQLPYPFTSNTTPQSENPKPSSPTIPQTRDLFNKIHNKDPDEHSLRFSRLATNYHNADASRGQAVQEPRDGPIEGLKSWKGGAGARYGSKTDFVSSPRRLLPRSGISAAVGGWVGRKKLRGVAMEDGPKRKEMRSMEKQKKAEKAVALLFYLSTFSNLISEKGKWKTSRQRGGVEERECRGISWTAFLAVLLAGSGLKGEPDHGAAACRRWLRGRMAPRVGAQQGCTTTRVLKIKGVREFVLFESVTNREIAGEDENHPVLEGVTVKVNAKIMEVEGPCGKLTCDFKHLNLDFELIQGGKKLKVDTWFGSQKTTTAIRTSLSHIENLVTGVIKGYHYKMRLVYAHFPINASITPNNGCIEIRNFLGEKKVHKVDMLEEVKIFRSEKVKDKLVLEGNDVELVSRSVALIN